MDTLGNSSTGVPVIKDDNPHFVRSTKRQIKNLNEHFRIDVQLFED